MLHAPVPDTEETRANKTFDAILWALSRPGHPRTLPEAEDAGIVACLLDRECKVHAADPLLIPTVMNTGAALADIDAADHVFLGKLNDANVLGHVRTGSDLYPDDGATVIVHASLNQGAAVTLSGPGVDGAVTIQIGGLPDGFWAARSRAMRYPMGFDLLIRDGDQLIGIPRSTVVEVS